MPVRGTSHLKPPINFVPRSMSGAISVTSAVVVAETGNPQHDWAQNSDEAGDGFCKQAMPFGRCISEDQSFYDVDLDCCLSPCTKRV